MSRNRKHRRARPEARAESAGTAATSNNLRADIVRDALKGLLFIAVFLAISFGVHKTAFGKQLALASYNLLQSRLLSPEESPVTIVDISELEPRDYNFPSGRSVRATPRDRLRDIISAIAEQHPRAIGVDVDFSPDEDGSLEEDPPFFEFCLDSTRVPVFVGVVRTVGRTSREWLGSERYQRLAANILIPNDIGKDGRMLNVIHVASTSSTPMSVALAKAYGDGGRTHGPFNGLHTSTIRLLTTLGVIDSIEVTSKSGVDLENFLVDFSALDSIEKQTLHTIDPAMLGGPMHRNDLEGKVVLLGDATLGKGSDTFVVPGRPTPYPGVFLHASSTYTLIKGPLFVMTEHGRLAIDVISSLLILVTVLLIRFHYGKAGQNVATDRVKGLLTVIVVLAPILGGVWFVRFTRIVWADFLLAFTALVFHPSIEHFLEETWLRFRMLVPAAWRRFALQPQEKTPK